MSAQPQHHDVPPPGAPVHWAHMPWRAREQWRRRQEKKQVRPRDEKGRLIWTEAEQVAANSAMDRHRAGTGPELTADQHDAYRAYQRSHGEARRRARGVPALGSDEDRRMRRARRVLEYVEAAQGFLTPRQVADELGMSVRAVAEALDAVGREDLVEPFRLAFNADRRASRAARVRATRARLPPAVDEVVEARRRVLDEVPRRSRAVPKPPSE
jgi:hypothetical protein